MYNFCFVFGRSDDLAMSVANIRNVNSDARQIIGIGKGLIAALQIGQIIQSNNSYRE